MAGEWTSENPINYQYGGETYDSLFRKTKLNFDQVFRLLNILRAGGAQAGLDATDSVPYQVRINTNDDCIYIRDKNNEQYIFLGEMAENFGITPEKISAIKNGGNVGKIGGGLDAAKPMTGNSTNDLYLATDTFTIYRWTGSAWKVFLSLQFNKLLNYEAYCVNRNEVAYNGKDKIPRLDAVTGKGNFDITGSPERILGYEIDVQDFKDGDVLVLNTQKGKIVNLPKDEIKKTDLTVSGEAGKIVKVHTDGKIHATLEGSASKIDNIKVNAAGIKNSQVLQYQSLRIRIPLLNQIPRRQARLVNSFAYILTELFTAAFICLMSKRRQAAKQRNSSKLPTMAISMANSTVRLLKLERSSCKSAI